MSPDQHYCVECGTRRGKPRFSLDNKPAPAPPPPPKKPRRLSSGVTMLLGLGVLMLALWTGVQLGNHNNGPTNAAATPKVVINNTGGGTGGGTAGASTSSTGGTSKQASNTGGKATKKPTATQKTVNLSGTQHTDINIHDLHTKAQRKAATKKALSQKTTLANGKQIGSEKTTLGSKCSDNTVGCTNGKYTGSYFGNGGG